MFVVLLKFSKNKGLAGQFMDGHKEWIRRGFDDGVFLLVGNLQPNLGGGIVAHHTSLADLEGRVKDDPFVAEDVVSAEILEIAPARVDDRLKPILGLAATPRSRGGDQTDEQDIRWTRRQVALPLVRCHAGISRLSRYRMGLSGR